MRAALLLLLTGCPMAAGVPGSRFDGGVTVDHQLTARLGAHVASFRKDRDASWDLGAGAAFNAPVGGMTASGGYLDAAWSQRVDRSTRLSVGPGLALLGRDGIVRPVGYLRADLALFAPAEGTSSGQGRCGFGVGYWYGQAALGVYLDVSRPLDGAGVSAVAGLTFRLPALAALGVGIPGCK
jgi:hypothetical protein